MEWRSSCFGSAETDANRCAEASRDASFAIDVREAVAADRESILALATRLTDFGLPPWRDPAQVVAAECETLGSILASPRAGASILVAVDSHQGLVGFVHVATGSDAHTRERHGQIISLVVAACSAPSACGPAIDCSSRALDPRARLSTSDHPDFCEKSCSRCVVPDRRVRRGDDPLSEVGTLIFKQQPGRCRHVSA